MAEETSTFFRPGRTGGGGLGEKGVGMNRGEEKITGTGLDLEILEETRRDGTMEGTEIHDALFGHSLGHFSRSVSELQTSISILEERCSELNWALEDSNRKLKESLADRERLASRLDGILRCLSAGVIAVNLEGRLTEFNPAAEKITGHNRDKVLGSDYRETVGRGVGERFGLPFTMEGGSTVENEEKNIVTAGNERIPVGYSTSLIRGEKSEITGAVEVFSDLRKAKLVEEELLRTRTFAALGEMAAEVARQIRNPLAGLTGFAEILGLELESNPKRCELVRKIQQGAAGVEQAIEKLLENTRSLPVEFYPVDTVAVVERALDLFESSLEESERIRLVRQMCRTEAIARINEGQILQALRHLLSNARESIDSGGEIRVAIRLEPARPAGAQSVGLESDADVVDDPVAFVVIRISDTGSGMTDDVAENAFSPFFSTKAKRIGLGLTSARRIVTGHGGDIILQTDEDGGTTVTVRLPSASDIPVDGGTE